MVNDLWESVQTKTSYRISWNLFANEEDLLRAYWKSPDKLSLAVLFQETNPVNGSLKQVVLVVNASNHI